MRQGRVVRRTSKEIVQFVGQNMDHFSKLGRRYARWQVWQDKLVYIIVFIVFMVWLEWTIHSEVFPPEVKKKIQTFPVVRGRCGPRFILPSGAPAKCEPSTSTCCSARGWCSNSPEDCMCDECLYYEWEEAKKSMPEDLPLEDDNSDFTLMGYQNFLIEPKIDCDNNKILLIVYTAINNFRYRQMIRLTWGNDKYLRQINATLIFVVGRFPNLKVQWRVEQEGRKYQDILQGDFFEDYFLLAYKSLTWMLWSKMKCSQIPWIVKTDDDMINNIWKLGALVEALKYQRNTITCSTKTERVIRQKTGGRIDKWVIPFDEWPDEFFPTNCWGVVYIMSQYVRNKLLQVFEKSDRGIFRVDDVFVTGMLAEKANVSHRDISDLITFYEDWDEEILLTGNVWFGHVPPDNEKLHKKRFWLWRRMVEHEFPQTWHQQIQIDRTRV